MAKEKTKKSQTRVKRNQKLYKDTIITESYAIHHSVIALLIISLAVNTFTIYHFLTFNHNKVKIVTKIKTEIEEKVPENIVFLGDSITEFYDLEKHYPNNKVVNSGIGGNNTQDILDDMKNRVYRYNPSKLFLLIGTNDLDQKRDIEDIIEDTKEIIKNIKENRENTTIYVESIYPVNKELKNNKTRNRNNENIKAINEKMKEYCEKEKITFIDIYNELKDEEDNLKEEYTTDGLHLNDEGYDVVTKMITKYLNDN